VLNKIGLMKCSWIVSGILLSCENCLVASTLCITDSKDYKNVATHDGSHSIPFLGIASDLACTQQIKNHPRRAPRAESWPLQVFVIINKLERHTFKFWVNFWLKLCVHWQRFFSNWDRDRRLALADNRESPANFGNLLQHGSHVQGYSALCATRNVY